MSIPLVLHEANTAALLDVVANAPQLCGLH